jgi:uncharacterized protein
MHFVVTAIDHTDEGALARRMANREAHLAGVRQLIANQQFLSGGAILDDSGKMIGSTLHVDFPDRVTLEACLQRDPYVTGRVWESVEIRPARFVAV